MFHNLQESDVYPFGGELPREEKRYITFSSTLSDRQLANVRHVGTYNFHPKLFLAVVSLYFMVASGLISAFFFCSLKPDYHEVTVQDPTPAVAWSPNNDPIDELFQADRMLAPTDHAIPPLTDPYTKGDVFANNVNGVDSVMHHMYDPAAGILPPSPGPETIPPAIYDTGAQWWDPTQGNSPLVQPITGPEVPDPVVGNANDPSSVQYDPNFWPAPPVDTGIPYYVGGASDTTAQPAIAGFSEGNNVLDYLAQMPTPTSHTEWQQYTSWVTWLKNDLRFLAGVAFFTISALILQRQLDLVRVLIQTLRVKLAKVPNRDLIRMIDTRGRQIGILYESMKEAVRRYNLGVSQPVDEHQVMDLFKQSLDGETDQKSANDIIVSQYLIDTAILEEKLQQKGFPMKKQLKRQMRDIADSTVAIMLPDFVETIYDRLDREAAGQTEQKVLEQGKRDTLMDEAEAILLGTEHLKVRVPV